VLGSSAGASPGPASIPRALVGRAGVSHLGAVWRAAIGLALVLAGPARAGGEPPAGDREYALVPLAGGDTDIGFGGGALGSVAALDPQVKPYRWRLEGTVFVTLKSRDGLSSPYQDGFLLLTINGLLGGRLRLELRPSYTRETNQRYYGLGNAAPAPPEDVPARDFFTRRRPTMLARARLQLRGPLYALLGTIVAHNAIAYGPASTLARDLASPDPRVRSLLHVDTRFWLHLLDVGLLLDTRDDEIEPQQGQLHTFKVRVSPWATPQAPFRYLQLNLTARAYHAPWPSRLVLAGRLIADLQVGDVPFFELARYDEASALGGANGVRGIPSDRYYGKRKLFGNLEARASLWTFAVRSGAYTLGLAGFLDGGRLWADVRPAPGLDGPSPGLKYGLGGGLRLRKGETFVLRADLAWSPDARPLGFYFLAGEIF
jgi:hypothetical protein